MTFSDLFPTLEIEHKVSQSLFTKKSDVAQVLKKDSFSILDFPALISPAAENFIEEIAQRSHKITKQRFGNTLQLFAPLYLSNECFNTCTYCGFSIEHQYKRKTLNESEILKEGKILREKGFQHILLLTGESPKSVDTRYISNAVTLLTPYFSSISIEVQPLIQSDYEVIIASGCDGLTLYQETYHKPSYLNYHLSGLKRKYVTRLNTPEEGAKAGFYRINLGALLGLYDWRYDALALAHHSRYMIKNYWQSKYAVSFNRINDMIGDFKINYPVSTMALVQLITAFRLVFPDIGITLSTRENKTLRDKLFKLGITTISAESDTSPGGYSGGTHEKQFEIEDNRTLSEIKDVIQQQGFDPVIKDWYS